MFALIWHSVLSPLSRILQLNCFDKISLHLIIDQLLKSRGRSVCGRNATHNHSLPDISTLINCHQSQINVPRFIWSDICHCDMNLAVMNLYCHYCTSQGPDLGKKNTSVSQLFRVWWCFTCLIWGVYVSTFRLSAMSPAPAEMQMGHIPYPPHRTMYPMRMMPQPPPHTDEMYQQWLQKEQYGPQHAMVKPTDIQTPVYTSGACRVQNVNWHPQVDDFNAALYDLQGGIDSNSGMSGYIDLIQYLHSYSVTL